MNVVIVGDGKVGRTLVEQLSKEGHNIVIIDSSERVLASSANEFDVMCIHGNGASHLVQIEAGVPRADLLIAATALDELNLLCCLVAKKLGARHTIARVRNPEYSGQLSFIRDELGLSMSINPEYAAANEIFRTLRYPAALKVETFSNGRVELVEIKLPPDTPLGGLSLLELYRRFQIKVLVCAVQRGNEVFIPGGDFVLQAGDKINVTAPATEIERFFKAIGVLRGKARNVIIVGGGHIAYYLSRRLLEIGMQVTIVDRSPERCRELSELLPRASIIEGDGTDPELLLEEGLESIDAFVSLTGMDEENIILSLFASSKGAGKVITKVNRTVLSDLVSSAGLDCVISPRDITANVIVRYVRAMKNTLGSNVETLHKLVGGRVEALEFRAQAPSPLFGITLRQLSLRPDLLIACIIRDREVIIPGGDDVIQPDDRVIAVTTSQQLSDLSDILLEHPAPGEVESL